MEDRETARMLKYGESKTTRIMMATVPHVTSSKGLRKFQASWIFLRQSVPKSSASNETGTEKDNLCLSTQLIT